MNAKKKLSEDYSRFNVSCGGYSGFRELETKDSISVGCTERCTNKYYKIYLGIKNIYNYEDSDSPNYGDLVACKIFMRISELLIKKNKYQWEWETAKEYDFNSYPELLNVLDNGTKVGELKKQLGNIDLDTVTLKQAMDIIRKLKEILK